MTDRDGEDVPRAELRLFLAACDERGIPEAQQEALWARFRAHYLRDLERRWRRKFDAFLNGDGSRWEQGPGVAEILRKHGRPLSLDILARLAGVEWDLVLAGHYYPEEERATLPQTTNARRASQHVRVTRSGRASHVGGDTQPESEPK